MKQKLELKTSSATTFTAWNNSNPDLIMIGNIDGWDERANKEVQTEQKLIGSGSYVISRQFTEKTTKIEINTLSSSRNLYESIETLYRNSTAISLTRSFYNDVDIIVRTRVVNGEIVAINDYTEVGKWGTIGFTVLLTNPSEVIS